MSPSDRIDAPLRPVEFYVLLGLAEGELHGYGIIQRTEEQSGGQIRLDPGTLYRAISRLRDAGLLAEVGRRDAEDLDDGRQRRYYSLTDEGRTVAGREARRLAALARHAVDTGLIDEGEMT